MTTKTIWNDKETGGLRAAQHDITQIAIILDLNGAVAEELNILMRPSDPRRLEPTALAVQKKTLEQVMAHPLSQKEGFELYRDALAKWTADGVKADWGGQNASFDVDFSKEFFRQNGDEGGLTRYFTGGTVDTRYLADGFRRTGAMKSANSKLGTICAELGVQLGDGAHDALFDIRATREAYYIMRQRFMAAA